jgi:membrane glycosyltransferase
MRPILVSLSARVCSVFQRRFFYLNFILFILFYFLVCIVCITVVTRIAGLKTILKARQKKQGRDEPRPKKNKTLFI